MALNLSPDAHVLHALSNQRLPWWQALAELVDNSFDANANRVVIETRKRVLVVSDDGKGIKDIASIATLGKHARQKSTKLGMYGIGAKDAWLSCSDSMSVETVHGGQLSTLSVSVQELIKNNWLCADPVSTPTDKPSGTKLSFPLRSGKSIPSTDAYEELAFTFTPALGNGMQILVDSGNGNRKALQPHALPTMSEIVQDAFQVEGKQVSINIGILPEGYTKKKSGAFWLIYKHRIIACSSIGAGKYSVMRVGGSITLGDGWKLSKNKDDLTQHKDELEQAVFARIEPLLKKASTLSESVALSSPESSRVAGQTGMRFRITGASRRYANEKRRGLDFFQRALRELHRRRLHSSAHAQEDVASPQIWNRKRAGRRSSRKSKRQSQVGCQSRSSFAGRFSSENPSSKIIFSCISAHSRAQSRAGCWHSDVVCHDASSEGNMVANVVINPEGFYDQEALSKLLGLKPVRITKAINAGELRSSERAGKRFIRGQWAIDWLEGSEASACLKSGNAEVIKAVDSGEMSLNKAKQIVDPPKPKPKAKPTPAYNKPSDEPGYIAEIKSYYDSLIAGDQWRVSDFANLIVCNCKAEEIATVLLLIQHWSK